MDLEFHYTITVGELLDGFREAHGSLGALRKRAQRKGATVEEVGALEEWESYERRNASPDETIKVTRLAIFHDPAAFFKILTPERVRILDALGHRGFGSIHELARHLGRDPKNVYHDVHALEELGFIALERRNARRVVPRARVARMTINLGGRAPPPPSPAPRDDARLARTGRAPRR